jgi:hypothetical protein
MSTWQTIYKSSLEHQVAIVRDVLAGADISAVIIDKKDHNYNMGVFEVRVNQEHVLRAIKLIQDEIDFA